MPQSLWSATFGGDPPRYDAEIDSGDAFDVAIVGAGYTGLWTAWSLIDSQPDLRIVVIDRARVGFGASGRNGGWCSARLPISLTRLAVRHGRDATVAMQQAMFDAVNAVGEFAAAAPPGPFDPDFQAGGTITLAHDPYQEARLEATVAEMRSFGFGQDDIGLLDASEAATHCRADGVTRAMFTPHCAAIHPLRLVHALADAAHRSGVHIAEGVDVHDVGPGLVHSSAGPIKADVVVLATEAYTAMMPGRRRAVVPLYSLMIGTEPLAPNEWAAIGLDERPTFTSATNMVIYGQRTADGRLAFGGRGAPYHFGSRIADRFDTDDRVRAHLRTAVVGLFPTLADVAFPYHWGGPLGIPRDWHPHVAFDASTGLASAGGYVGDGVATANLAGRTLADLILRRATDLARLPWVGHRSRRWEPEPLRWLGVRLGAMAASRADAAESATGPRASRRAAAWSKLLAMLTNH